MTPTEKKRPEEKEEQRKNNKKDHEDHDTGNGGFSSVAPGNERDRWTQGIPISSADPISHQATLHDVPGKYAPITSKTLHMVLYGARAARKDLLKAVNNLARFISRLSLECDAKLLRLMEYIHSTVEWREVNWIGDSIKDLPLDLSRMPTSLAARPPLSQRVVASIVFLDLIPGSDLLLPVRHRTW